MSNNSIDLLSILKEKLSNKEIKIEPGALSTAAIVASSTNFREVVKVMLHNDEKT
ncbi:MAG: hypothetical protein GX638_10215, partial [Crenarchaeota archaeon]|nr:hypothetical protein [Thermoproteota archaeon]